MFFIVSHENININSCLEHVSSPRMGQDKKVISFIEKPKLFPIRTIPLYQYVVHCVEFFVDREFRISRLCETIGRKKGIQSRKRETLDEKRGGTDFHGTFNRKKKEREKKEREKREKIVKKKKRERKKVKNKKKNRVGHKGGNRKK